MNFEPVSVSDHQFLLVDEGAEFVPTPGLSNGLIDLQPGGAIVRTGIDHGSVNAAVEARDTPPPAVDLAGWEEVVETSVHAEGGLFIGALFTWGPHLPELNPDGPGDYRIRVHARGRDDGVEEYLFMAWPGPPAPEIAQKQTDRHGAQTRAAWAHAVANASAEPYEPPPVERPSGGRVEVHSPEQPANPLPGHVWQTLAQRVGP